MYALVIAGFLAGAGYSSEILTVLQTEQECKSAVEELNKVKWNKTVLSVGYACIKLNGNQPV